MPDQHWMPFRSQYVENPDPGIITYDHLKDRLLEYDLGDGSLRKEIPVHIFHNVRDEARDFYYVNDDSIFFLNNSSKNPGFSHDSTLFLLNASGEILKSYDLSAAPLWTSRQTHLSKDSVYLITGSLVLLRYFSGKIVTNIERFNYGPGDTLFGTPEGYGVGYFDLSADPPSFEFAPVPVHHRIGEYYPRDFKRISYVHDDSFHYAYFATMNRPEVYRQDLHSGNWDTAYLRSYVFDTVPHLSGTWMMPWDRDIEPQYGRYKSLIYDPYRQYILRGSSFPIQGVGEEYMATRNRAGSIIFDRELNPIGQSIYPERHFMAGFLPRGIAMFDMRNRNSSSMEWKIRIFEYQFEEVPLEEFHEQAIVKAPRRKPGGWDAYLKSEMGITSQKCAVLFIPVDLGCKGCLNEMLEYFIQLDTSTLSVPLYCVLAASDIRTTRQKIKALQITEDFPNLLVDQHSEFRSYVGNNFLQGRLFFLENGTVSLETKIEPATMHTLPILLSSFLQ
ncbi:hypothetical protein [Pontibacter sp. G13]|uniref:hypothetical protein n=1 Tax=Pontibacter sp. G13 TaxID=3074898 RepID=UPI00288BC4A5|nr:hypothetical protein [Pontibacter sp. G13]WNJ16425.1 hypothetical protein RJD25_16290 [Pontibacter sp. G13]